MIRNITSMSIEGTQRKVSNDSYPFIFRGRELQRRLAERVREADLDSKDRNKEQEELDELKNKIFSGEYDNPTLEFEKVI